MGIRIKSHEPNTKTPKKTTLCFSDDLNSPTLKFLMREDLSQLPPAGNLLWFVEYQREFLCIVFERELMAEMYLDQQTLSCESWRRLQGADLWCSGAQ